LQPGHAKQHARLFVVVCVERLGGVGELREHCLLAGLRRHEHLDLRLMSGRDALAHAQL
jgi:hypothetical protein